MYFSHLGLRIHRRQAATGELTLRDLQEWISEREDVAAFLHNFTEARLIISSLEVRALHLKNNVNGPRHVGS